MPVWLAGIARRLWTIRFWLWVVLGLIVAPFVVAVWLALWRVAMGLVWIELFPVSP